MRSALHAAFGAAALVAAAVVAATPALSTTVPAPGAATDAGPAGRWDREDGLGGVEIAPCGDALCGHITWLRDASSPARVGQQVLYGMRRTAEDSWSGSAFNPEDGRTYAGTLVLAGSRLLTKGCILGGLICRSVALTRAR